MKMQRRKDRRAKGVFVLDIETYRQIAARGELLEAGELQALMRGMALEAQRVTAKINGGFHTPEELRALVTELTGNAPGEGFCLFPPIYTDFGKNLFFGKDVFVNSACCFQDQGGIYIGDNCLIGHQVVFASLNHLLDPARRASMQPAPIRLGKNVWVGSHATILAGVTVGDNAVIAAGAVVSKDVPPNTVVGGVPARILKTIEAEARPAGNSY